MDWLDLKTWASQIWRESLSTHALHPPLSLAGNSVYILAYFKAERETNCWAVRWIIYRPSFLLVIARVKNLKDNGFRAIPV